jgi:[amino-group carrier protein]-gamma-(L-lysyl/L-ornithyl)-L-glutamate aminotransferase
VTEPRGSGREFGAGATPRITLVRGEGAYLFDAEGRRFVDLGASLGVGNLGHANPRVAAAIRRQAGELLHIGSALTTPAREAMVSRLLATMPASLDRVFLSNSGTEAMETAIKIARSSTGRPRAVAMMRGFHGRTLGALSATWRRELREPFEPLLSGFVHVPFNDVPRLREAVDDSTGAVLLEIVQGEGGVHVVTPEFLQAAREACDVHGALLIFDEIQTGMGRTGRRWAFERFGVVPDILAVAKSLAGGVPVGATVTSSAVEARFRGTLHSTFGGNPLACAAGVAALEELTERRLDERAERLGAMVPERLASLPPSRVREVRGLGLMWGIELKERAAPVLEAMRERGFLATSAGSQVIRLLPPLVIEETDWAAGLDALAELLRR